jgi:hypothetical protein
VAIFPQHTSRSGDPQLHVHILWLNKVKTGAGPGVADVFAALSLSVCVLSTAST